MHFLFQASEFTSANIRSYGMLPNQFREKHGKIRHEYGKLWDSILSDAQNDGAIRSDIKIVPLRQVMLGALNWTVEWFDPNRAGMEGNLSLPEFSEMLIKLLLEGICDRENATATRQASFTERSKVQIRPRGSDTVPLRRVSPGLSAN